MVERQVWPLIGRDAERAIVLDAVGAGAVVIAGRAGVGKTRLARDCVGALAAEGWATAWITGSGAAAGIPFGAVASLLPAPTSSLFTGGAVDSMAAARHAVAARASERGLVLGVDDAHRLDEASAALVLQLVATSAARAVVTVRGDELAPDAVTALWKDGLAERIELQPLSGTEVRELLKEVLGAPVDGRSAAELVRSCAGNCLFLREVVRAALAEGRLTPTDGLWHLVGPLPTSDRLAELVEARTRGLSPASRTALELVVVGEPLPLAVLERAVEPAVLEELAAAELIEIDLDGRRVGVRLAHPLYGDALRSRLPALSLRSRCGTLAGAMATTGLRRSDDVVRLVTWQLDAGQRADPGRLLAAAHRSVEGARPDAAERFAAAAVNELSGPAAAPALLALADAQGRAGRLPEAVTTLSGVDAGGDDLLVARVAEMRANALYLGGGTPGDALDHLAEVAPRVTLADARARLAVARARILGGLGRPREALALLDAAEPMTPALESHALGVRGPALAFLCRFTELDAAIARGLDPALAPDEDPSSGLGWVTSCLLLGASGRGDTSGGAELAALVRDEGAKLRHGGMVRSGSGAAAWFLFHRGDLTGAVEAANDALHVVESLETDGIATLALAALAGARALAGDLDGSAATLARAVTEERPPVGWFDPLLDLAGSLLDWRRGFVTDAAARLTAALATARAADLHQVSLYLALTACRIGRPELTADHLDGLADAEGPLPALCAGWAAALAAGDGAALDGTSERLEAQGMVLAAAETSAAAGEAHGRRGDSRAALAARARAWRLVERCPGADTGFLGGGAVAGRITARELEIARLAASGLRGPEIAERLYISLRTVDSHLGRVYAKLGIEGRAELADALTGHPDETQPDGC